MPHKVSLRETFGARASGRGRHVKQSGGHGQFAICEIEVEPLPTGAGFEFVDRVVGGAVPKQFIPSVEKGVRAQLAKGVAAGYPVVDVRVTLLDGKAHSVDSSDIAFQAAARGAFREVYARAKPQILEPIMKVSIEGPSEYQGAFVRTVMQRRGMIVGTTETEGFVRVDAEVPLAEMFGYSTDLRSSSQGKAEYTMEFARYAPVPGEVATELVKKYGSAKKDDEE